MTLPPPGCGQYRQEMLLLALRRRLARTDIPEKEKQRIRQEVHELERQLNMA